MDDLFDYIEDRKQEFKDQQYMDILQFIGRIKEENEKHIEIRVLKLQTFWQGCKYGIGDDDKIIIEKRSYHIMKVPVNTLDELRENRLFRISAADVKIIEEGDSVYDTDDFDEILHEIDIRYIYLNSL